MWSISVRKGWQEHRLFFSVCFVIRKCLAISLYVLWQRRRSIFNSLHDFFILDWNSHDVSVASWTWPDLCPVSRYLELFLGQFYRCGNITLWGRIAPSMKGIGIASFLIVTAVTLFYTTIIGRMTNTYHRDRVSFFSTRTFLSNCFVSTDYALEYLFAHLEYRWLFRTNAIERWVPSKSFSERCQ